MEPSILGLFRRDYGLSDEQQLKLELLRERLGASSLLGKIAIFRQTGHVIPHISLGFGEAIDYLYEYEQENK